MLRFGSLKLLDFVIWLDVGWHRNCEKERDRKIAKLSLFVF